MELAKKSLLSPTLQAKYFNGKTVEDALNLYGLDELYTQTFNNETKTFASSYCILWWDSDYSVIKKFFDGTYNTLYVVTDGLTITNNGTSNSGYRIGMIFYSSSSGFYYWQDSDGLLTVGSTYTYPNNIFQMPVKYRKSYLTQDANHIVRFQQAGGSVDYYVNKSYPQGSNYELNYTIYGNGPISLSGTIGFYGRKI